MERRNCPRIVILSRKAESVRQHVRDAGSVIPDLIRDRHDANNSLCKAIGQRLVIGAPLFYIQGQTAYLCDDCRS